MSPPLAPVLSQMNPVHLTFSLFTLLLHPESKLLQPYFEEQLEVSVFQLLVA
jgi:hypothetical protein